MDFQIFRRNKQKERKRGEREIPVLSVAGSLTNLSNKEAVAIQFN